MQRGALAWLLLPAALLFGFAVWLRRLLYASGLLPQIRLPVPVIVVGNLLAGGSGKTPVVIALVQALAAAGYRPGVVSRGYGGSAEGTLRVTADTDPAIAGDEPVLIAKRTRCPVWVGRRRAAAAKALLATDPECDIIVADDGLQHLALARNFEIAVFDDRGVGNGWLMPSGPLREPMSQLAAVDAVLYQGSAAAPVGHAHAFSFRVAGDAFVQVAGSEARTAAAFAGKQVVAIAGIGNPQRFFATLEALGIRADCKTFPDHFGYRSEDLAYPQADAILMTEKDAVKCVGFAPPNAWALRVDAELPLALVNRLLEKIDGP
jgi:tetraacyldisaccharide 4'-kinase